MRKVFKNWLFDLKLVFSLVAQRQEALKSGNSTNMALDPFGRGYFFYE